MIKNGDTTAAAVSAFVCGNDAAPWMQLLDVTDECTDGMKQALLESIPFAPILDNATDPICAFAKRYPTAAIDLWTSLLLFNHNLSNTSEVRNWVLHVMNLTGVLAALSPPRGDRRQGEALLQACAMSMRSERRRHIAKRLHAFAVALADLLQLHVPPPATTPQSDDIIAHLDLLARHRGQHATKALVAAVAFLHKWPQSNAPKDDPRVVHRIKLLACLHPELFQSILNHWLGLGYISRHEFDHRLRHGPILEDILMCTAAHPIRWRLEASMMQWPVAKSSSSVDVVAPCRYITWTASDALSDAVLDDVLAELTLVAAHCPAYALAPVVLAAWALVLHVSDIPTQLEPTLRLFWTAFLRPVVAVDHSPALIAVLSLVVESRMGAWDVWAVCSHVLAHAIVFAAKLYDDAAPSTTQQRVAATLLQSLLAQCAVSVLVAVEKKKFLLPVEARAILETRLRR
ncbi:Aste57867_1630 [Aphanomyces stellatus]|uniref:Aste57867_1630 protein n=1 Tax=Aphanomyces stellatus TaxID=120398 RepID=A0A485K649_9STRA|nr:hypothetical protein As57867_001628 [Aphanomyces stellatus]VFT78843.1 Aste57867_1630 [Aphanomyces stellatus]